MPKKKYFLHRAALKMKNLSLKMAAIDTALERIFLAQVRLG